MIYNDGCEPDPIAELQRVFAGVAQPREFVFAGVGAFIPDDGEDRYIAAEASRFGLPVHRHATEPTHAKMRTARTALGAGLLGAPPVAVDFGAAIRDACRVVNAAYDGPLRRWPRRAPVIARIVSALDAIVQRDSLTSQLRALRVPHWPWDSNATLRRRLDCAMMFGYPSERADPLWLATLEGRMMMIELRLMQALGVAK